MTALFDDRVLEGVMLRLLEDTVGSPSLQLLAVLTATGIGAVHALGPGHGKVLVAAYLASSRGRTRDAVALGGLVAAMHTATVSVLGIAFASLQRVPGGDRLDAGLRLASGLAVSAVGVWLVHRHLGASSRRRSMALSSPGRAAVMPRDADASPSDGDGVHGHEHLEHDRAHGHDHGLAAEVRPLPRAGVVALASSGGLLPSPAAFVVLASAIALGRPGFGLVLVLAFGLGLALTLTGVGVSIVWGRGRVERLGGSVTWLRRGSRVLPLTTALVVTTGGVALSVAAMLAW